MAGQNGEPDPFGRRNLDFESMREQMEKERENFFRGVNPRDWPDDPNASRGGIFNRPRTSLGGFPSGPAMRGARYVNDFPAATADEFSDGFGLMPGSQPAARQHKSGCGSGGQCVPEDEGSEHRSGGSVPVHLQQDQESIPIHVAHERAGPPRHKYSTARNTTELPAKASVGGCESPRLERAASEPPNKFAQRLNLSKPCYNTIPESGGVETKFGAGHHQPNRPSQLQDPGVTSSIRTSASSPSVSTADSQQPVPPPRKSPPRPSTMAQPGPGLPTTSTANVRHIPIFVEGRPEPIFNTNLKGASSAPAEAGSNPAPPPATDCSFPKPSDYYPSGVQRVKSRDATLTPESPQFQGEPLKMGNKPVVPLDEPTTPAGPPPGPIPMGYIPTSTLSEPEVPKEPTTPQGPPPGPIPMGYVPSHPLATGGEPGQEVQPPPPPQRNRVPGQQLPGPAQEQLMTAPPEESDAVNGKAVDAIPNQRRSTESPTTPVQQAATQAQRTRTLDKERKASTEPPTVNVVPIKVEGGRSRGSSQEPRPGKSPTPARSTPQPSNEQSTSTPINPKVAKLDKIKEEVDVLKEKISNFSGTKKDKEYLYLDEMLTRHLIALDGIEPEGQLDIRQMRKESIKDVNMCLSLLDEKVIEEGEAS